MTSRFLFVIPYLLSALVSAGVGVYAWRRPAVLGARPLAISAFSQSFWTVGYAAELLSLTLDGKLFWDDLQFLGTGGWVLAFLWFATEYTGREIPWARALWSLTFAVLGAYLTLVFTDPLHHLIRPEARLVPSGWSPELVYPFSVVTWAGFLYMMAIFALSMYILASHSFATRWVYRKQTLIVLVGTLIPLLGVTLTMLGVSLPLRRDTTPITFALSNLVIALGLFRYGLLDLVPVASDAVIENLNDGVVVLDAENRVLDLNRKAVELTGKAAHDVIGQSVASSFPDWTEILSRPPYAGRVQGELCVEHSGEIRYLHLTVTDIHDARGRARGRVAVTHDVTPLKNAEQSLQQQNELLESVNRELDAFSYSVSHDLRAPVRAIQGFTRILLADRTAWDPRALDYLERIYGSAERMQQLIGALLEFARLGQRPLQKKDVDLRTMVQEILDDLCSTFGNRKIEIRLAELPSCRADPVLLRRVLVNLLENALKFSRDRDPARIEIGFFDEAGKTVYFVRDNGAGFDMRQRDRLFGVFQRLHDSSDFEGTGIGLAISGRIVRRHGGRIWAEAEVNEGATFSFTLGD